MSIVSEEPMLKMLEELVNIDSFSLDKAGVDKVGHYLINRFQELDFVHQVYANEELGNHIVLQHKNANDPGILIIAHMDTVFPSGTAKERPFKRDGNLAFGPGVIDMKASHVLMFTALLNLKMEGEEALKNIQILFNSDEELGSISSKELIEKYAKDKNVVLVMEPARADGSIVSARRGTGKYQLRVNGKAAHAGIEPENGRSAIDVLAKKIVKLHALTDFSTGVHVNVGTIEGGTSANAVAAEAYATIDLRIQKTEQAPILDEQIHQICNEIELDGVTTELTGGITRLPMVFNHQTEKLIKLIEEESKALNIAFSHVATGGGSDASFPSALGIPTIDGLGPIGGKQHSQDEYLEIDSLVDRTQLFIRILKRLTSEPI